MELLEFWVATTPLILAPVEGVKGALLAPSNVFHTFIQCYIYFVAPPPPAPYLYPMEIRILEFSPRQIRTPNLSWFPLSPPFLPFFSINNSVIY